MRVSVATVVVSTVLLLACVQQVVGHGWLMDPVPRSGGGTGSGNAATNSPCGKAGPTTITATYTSGTAVTVTYKRANAHGASGNNVDFKLSFDAATAVGGPTNAHFASGDAVGSNLPMSVTDNNPQTATINLPPNKNGTAVLQFKWQPRDGAGNNAGGAWFDCAYIKINAAIDPACVTNHGGCDSNALCSGVSKAVCKCVAGFFGSGKTCTALPADYPVAITVTAATVTQDTFTANIAEILGIDVGRVLYDRSETVASDPTITDADGVPYPLLKVYIAIGADPVKGTSGKVKADELLDKVAAGKTSVASTLGVQMVPTVSTADKAVTFGEEAGTDGGHHGGGSSSSSTSTNFGMAFGVAIAITIFVAGGLVLVQRKRASATSSSSKMLQTSDSGATVNSLHTQDAYSRAYANALTSNVATNANSPANWTVQYNDEGVIYYYNTVTGVSQWEKPAGF